MARSPHRSRTDLYVLDRQATRAGQGIGPPAVVAGRRLSGNGKENGRRIFAALATRQKGTRRKEHNVYRIRETGFRNRSEKPRIHRCIRSVWRSWCDEYS
jgi:hypothetical protein